MEEGSLPKFTWACGLEDFWRDDSLRTEDGRMKMEE